MEAVRRSADIMQAPMGFCYWRQGQMSTPVRWRNLGSVLRQLLSARQNLREAYLYRQLDERRRSASCEKQMPRVSYCRAQQWRRDHGLAGIIFGVNPPCRAIQART